MERSKSNMSDRINCNSSIAVSTSISVSSNNPKGTTLYRYSPENVPPEILKNIFVGRDDIFEKTFKELETAGKNKTPRFYLIVGSRGIGKSHFLIMLYYRIKQELSSFYIPIKFAEEEYSVYRASDFFLRILQERNEDISGILSLRDEDEILDASLDRLKEIAKKENKTYLIFVENLHEVFRQFDVKEVQKLRSIFQKYDFFSIIASSPIIFPGVAESEEPFYNFFRIQHLREFTVDEIKILLKKIAEIEGNIEFLENFKKCEPRIEGITHLTGGSPRLVIFFYELIARENFEDLEKVFFKILDEHTPYYQEIFQLLTGQKRLIFDTVISSESPMTPKQIAEKSRIDASVVITQLRRLEKDRYVLSRPAGRETYYEVRERLFRLWRDMRQPLGRNRISVFMDFLKLWYTSNEQKKLFEKKFRLLESGNKGVLKDLCYYIEVLPDEYKTEALLKLTPTMIDLGEWEEADYDIQKLKEIMSQNTDKDLKAQYLIFKSLSNYKNNQKILKIFKEALKFGSKDYYSLLDAGYNVIYQELIEAFNQVLKLNPEDVYALSRKGSALASLERYQESIESFNKILDLNPEDVYALSKKGSILVLLERYEESIKIFNKVLELNPEDEYALSRKGSALSYLERYEESIETFNKVLDLSPKNEHILINKGFSLFLSEKYSEAIDIFNEVLRSNPENKYALLVKGQSLNLLEMYDEAIEIFNKVLDLNPADEYALSRKGSALFSLGKHDEAIEVFNKVLDLNPADEYALSRKGSALFSLGKHDEAIEVFNRVLDLNPENGFALLIKGNILNLLERHAEAINVLIKVNSETDNELLKVISALSLTETYVFLNNTTDAIGVIESIMDTIHDQNSQLIEEYIDLLWDIICKELKIGNLGNGKKLIKSIFDLESQLEKETFEASMINFFKKAVDSGELGILKIAISEILELKVDKYSELLRPLVKAVEIVETQDIQKYYKLQVEEREIVADIVQKISKSGDLLP
ncbi:hypothetical protein MSSAC_4389 [Methanosarcina siciliae C2J]|uniref:HTH arsR-type domain-containing protein n=1 Tax=Methanosarcina siciliae C2J TaxID=1434118 RepID=A0A0E3PUB9_9EURY|nr:tetratricopeptide repeat protein [Methanosarcina siciliae]AKB38979.1 hypothetical protein MSSAC_4389 [Methanosarcina siciliae C2J]